MSSIKLSPNYGVNPTIPVCAWCNEPKNEIALLGKLGDGRKGEDFQAPMYCVLDYEPCDKCKEIWSQGFVIIEVKTSPFVQGQPPMLIQDGTSLYPTGRHLVVTREAAERMFNPEYTKKGKLLVDTEVYEQLLPKE